MGNSALADNSSQHFPAADAVLQQAIRDHAFPGAAYGIWLRGERIAASAGRFTYEPDAPRVEPETIYDLASVSKVVATTAMAMLLWQHGQLNLDQPIADFLPEFSETPDATSHADRQRVSVRMLLAHSSGLPAYARLFETCETPAALLDACLHLPLEAPPGTHTAYSDIGFILLGHLLERMAGETLYSFCQREIFAPLSMEHTKFCPPVAWKIAIPPTQIDETLRHRLIQGEVQDENCWRLGSVSGHAGVFSNVPDLLRFAACILQSGAPIFRPETVQRFTTRDTTIAGSSRALGWDTPSQPSSSGQYFSPHSSWHLGYTGTSLWLDFEKQLAVVLLTNRTFPGNGLDGISKAIQHVRPSFHDALLLELGLAG